MIRLTKAYASKELPMEAMTDEDGQVYAHFRPVVVSMVENRLELSLELTADEMVATASVRNDIENFGNEVRSFCNEKCQSFWALVGPEFEEPDRTYRTMNNPYGGKSIVVNGKAQVMFNHKEDLELFTKQFALMKKLST